MTIKKLIGSAPSQISRNRDLGSLAFMNANSVNIKGGNVENIDNFSLDKIYNQLLSSSETIYKVFIYDTRKDSDGGAWRKRCHSTSWFNETLNTPTRGGRKDFPSVAIIAATDTNMYIFDGDDTNLPMWMVFQKGPDANPTTWWDGNNSNVPAGIGAMNGMVMLSTSFAGSYLVDFISEKLCIFYTSALGSGIRQTGVVNRNTYFTRNSNGAGYWGGYTFPQQGGDVAVTVSPTATIDTYSKLPVPTFAVASGSGGIWLFHGSGTVSSLSETAGSPSGRAYSKVAIIGNDVYAFSATNGTVQYFKNAIITNKSLGISSRYNYSFDSNYGTTSAESYPAILGQGVILAGGLYGKGSVIYCGCTDTTFTGVGVSVLYSSKSSFLSNPVNTSVSYNAMIAYIGPTWTTGYLPGTIRGAWLTSCQSGSLNASELFSSSNFTSTSSWTVSNTGTLTLAGGGTYCTLSSTSYAGIYQAVSNLEVGKTYVVQCNFSVNASYGNLQLRVWPGVTTPTGTYSETTRTLSGTAGNATDSNGTTGNLTFKWVATATTACFHFIPGAGSTVSGTTAFYSASLMLESGIEYERSVCHTTAKVSSGGTITKSPVATNAELQAYSGFSSSNYIQIDSATTCPLAGDFAVMGWVNCEDTSNTVKAIISRYNAAATVGFNISIHGDGSLYLYTRGTGGTFYTPYTIGAGASYAVHGRGWTHFVAMRRNNFLIIYVNGQVYSVYNGNTANGIGNQESPVRLGWHYDGSTYHASPGKLALIRYSSTAPTEEQIKKMYEDERSLFLPDAMATIYGGTEHVTAVDYDQQTNLAHIGTLAGRSVFHGLRRIYNTSIPVSKTISATNGMVAEQ